MADTVTSQTILDGERNCVMKFTNVSDGTGESAVVKILPACAATVKVVSAVKLTTFALPAEINPASDCIGPLKVDFPILSLLN